MDLLNDNGGSYLYRGNTVPSYLSQFQRQINIPTWTWKVVVPIDNNDTPTGAFAYLIPNEAEPISDWNQVPIGGVAHPFSRLGIYRPNIKTALDWRKTNTWRIDLSELQNILKK